MKASEEGRASEEGQCKSYRAIAQFQRRTRSLQIRNKNRRRCQHLHRRRRQQMYCPTRCIVIFIVVIIFIVVVVSIFIVVVVSIFIVVVVVHRRRCQHVQRSFSVTKSLCFPTLYSMR